MVTIRLRQIRRAHDVTQEELANAVGTSRQTIIAIERGLWMALPARCGKATDRKLSWLPGPAHAAPAGWFHQPAEYPVTVNSDASAGKAGSANPPRRAPSWPKFAWITPPQGDEIASPGGRGAYPPHILGSLCKPKLWGRNNFVFAI